MQCGRGLSISDPTNGEGSLPTTDKYARRGDIAFIGGGAILVIGLWIVGGLAHFDCRVATAEACDEIDCPDAG